MQSPPLGIQYASPLTSSINSTFQVGYQPTVSYAATGTYPTTTYPTPIYPTTTYSQFLSGLRRRYATYQNSFIVCPQRTNYVAPPFRYAPSYRYFAPTFDYGPYYRN